VSAVDEIVEVGLAHRPLLLGNDHQCREDLPRMGS